MFDIITFNDNGKAGKTKNKQNKTNQYCKSPVLQSVTWENRKIQKVKFKSRALTTNTTKALVS